MGPEDPQSCPPLLVPYGGHQFGTCSNFRSSTGADISWILNGIWLVQANVTHLTGMLSFLNFDKVFTEHCMKMKEIGPREGIPSSPWIRY